MSEADLRAIYHYIRTAGSVGQPAPVALPPAQTPPMYFVRFP